jgi:hypothetical protein
VSCRTALALAAICCAFPASALLIRPDRDDAEYLELATRYASAIPLGASGGEGVLIAPRWVLTSADRARELQDRRPASLSLGGRLHAVESVFLHPDWRPGGANDLALVFLKAPMEGVAPTAPYAGSDEAGKSVVIAASGATGRIGDPPAALRTDGRKRAAINTVDRVTANTFGMRIKPPDEASDLQGALVPAESGAPAYIETPQGLFVAGIAQQARGGWETYARVSAFADWIEATMWQVAKAASETVRGRRAP